MLKLYLTHIFLKPWFKLFFVPINHQSKWRVCHLKNLIIFNSILPVVFCVCGGVFMGTKKNQIKNTKWSKVKQSEVKRSKAKWSKVKWSEVKWSEAKWSEAKQSKVKQSKVKWSEAKWRTIEYGAKKRKNLPPKKRKKFFWAIFWIVKKNSKTTYGFGAFYPNALRMICFSVSCDCFCH